mgnify:CR=1 FL=1
MCVCVCVCVCVCGVCQGGLGIRNCVWGLGGVAGRPGPVRPGGTRQRYLPAGLHAHPQQRRGVPGKATAAAVLLHCSACTIRVSSRSLVLPGTHTYAFFSLCSLTHTQVRPHPVPWLPRGWPACHRQHARLRRPPPLPVRPLRTARHSHPARAAATAVAGAGAAQGQAGAQRVQGQAQAGAEDA